MSRSVSRQRVDDIDGSRPAHPVVFTLDGQRFEIDLGDAQAARLREVFAPYIAAGRKAGTGHSASAKRLNTDTVGRSPRRSRAGGSASAGPRTDGHPTDQSPPTEQSPPTGQHLLNPQSTVSRPAASSLERPSRRTPPTTVTENEPLAVVVPLPRRPRVQASGPDVVGQRRRLVAELGELTRVVAVAVLAAAADRLIGVIVKPSNCPADGENSGHRVRDTPGMPSSSSMTPAGEVELTEGVTAT